jgi:hypothetical protein
MGSPDWRQALSPSQVGTTNGNRCPTLFRGPGGEPVIAAHSNRLNGSEWSAPGWSAAAWG